MVYIQAHFFAGVRAHGMWEPNVRPRPLFDRSSVTRAGIGLLTQGCSNDCAGVIPGTGNGRTAAERSRKKRKRTGWG